MGPLMPFSLISDSLGRDARWMALARLGEPAERPFTPTRVRARRNALGFAYMRMLCEAALQRDDGYIGRDEALECCDGETWILDALATPVRGRPPFLHRPGQRCGERNCIDTSPPWVPGFQYRLCGFLKRNPSRAEQDRSKAQKDDSRDARLRELVYDRDGGCCRYCRSGPLRKRGMGRAKDRRRALQYDHVDPDKPAGPDGDNYVTACGRCNEDKGHRTPDEAGMTLLPVPTEDVKAAWLERGEALFDNATDNHSDKPPDNQHDKQHGVVGTFVGAVVPGVVDALVTADESAGERQEQPLDNPSEGSGSGRVGVPPAVVVSGPLGQPIRGPDAPDIWTRRSRAPEPRAGPP